MRHEMRGARRILAYCDKAMGAICLDRHILRLACVQFGGRTQTMGRWRSRERPLLYLATNQPGSRREWIRGRSVFYLTMSEHGECKGLAGGCVHCRAALAEGRLHEAFVDSELRSCWSCTSSARIRTEHWDRKGCFWAQF